MEQFVVICAGHAGITHPDQPPAPVGHFLKSYRPEAHNGRGEADWTIELRFARRFVSKEQAWEYWRQVPKSRPTRPDGQPNRPLTAYTIAIEPAPE
jgi:hypothetical protein